MRVQAPGHDDDRHETAQLREPLADGERAEAAHERAPARQVLDQRLDGLDDLVVLERLRPRIGGRLDVGAVVAHG